MKKLLIVMTLLFASSTSAQYPTTSFTAGGNITAASASCLATNCVPIKLPASATTLTVGVTGTFSATLAVEESQDGGRTWTSAGSNITGAGTTSFTITAFSDFRVRASAYVSGNAGINILVSASTNSGGGGVSSLNSLSGAVTIAAGTNVTLTPSGNTITIASTGGGGAVSSVSNSDSSLVISPTTGTVVASLNPANANTWTALQTFGTNISIGGVTPTGATGTGNAVFSSSPTLTTPNLGTPSAAILTNATGLPAASVAIGALANGMTATTQPLADASTKLATDQFVLANGITLGPTVIYASSSGAVSGYEAWDCATTSGSPNVVCTNTTFTTAMIGWLAHATGPDSLGVGGAYLFPLNSGAENTITGCSPSCPSKTAILTQNANASVAAGSVAFTFGPDSTTALTNLFNTAFNSPTTSPNCPTVILTGLYLTKKGQANTATCENFSSEVGDTQATITSPGGPFSGMLAPTQDFDFTTGSGNSCGGGVQNNTCFFGIPGIRLRNMGINGGDASLTGHTFSTVVHITDISDDSDMFGFYCVGWGSTSGGGSGGTFVGVVLRQVQPIQDTQVDGCGNVALQTTGTQGSQKIITSFFGDTGVAGNFNGSAAYFSSPVVSIANGYDSPGAGASANINVEVDNLNGTSTVESFGDAVSCGSATSTTAWRNNTGAIFHGWGLNISCPASNDTALQFVSTGTGGCSGCTLSGDANTRGLFVGNTASFVSGGMNNINGVDNAATTTSIVFDPSDILTGTFTTFTPTITATGLSTTGSITAALNTGVQTIERTTFTFTPTGVPLATGTVVDTFNQTYGPNGQAPACMLQLGNGTESWTAPPGIVLTASGQSTTSYSWTWTAATAPASTGTLTGVITCSAR